MANDFYDPNSPEAQQAQEEAERARAQESQAAVAQKKVDANEELIRRMEASGAGMDATGQRAIAGIRKPSLSAPLFPTPGSAGEIEEKDNATRPENTRPIWEMTGGALPDEDPLLVGIAGAGLEGGPEKISPENVSLTWENRRLQNQAAIDAIGSEIQLNSIMAALASNDLNKAIEIARGYGEKVVGPKPTVRDDALRQKREQGPMQMARPDFPDLDNQIIARQTIAAIGNMVKHLGAGGLGGQMSAVAGMVVDPGTKILSETGKMLSSEVDKYQAKDEKIENLNFMLEKEYRDDLIKMQDALDQRLDANDRAYMAQVSAATQNSLARYENLFSQLQQQKRAIGMATGQAADATINQQELVNAEYAMSAKTANAQMRQSWRVATAAHTLSQLRVQSEARKRGGNAGFLLNNAANGARSISMAASVFGKNSPLLGQMSNATNNMIRNGSFAENDVAAQPREIQAITHNKASGLDQDFLVYTKDLGHDKRAHVAIALEQAGRFGPNTMNAQEWQEFVARTIAAASKAPVAGKTGEAMVSYMSPEVFDPYVKALVRKGWVRDLGNGRLESVRPSKDTGATDKDILDHAVLSNATPLSMLYILQDWGSELAASVQKGPRGEFPGEGTAAINTAEGGK